MRHGTEVATPRGCGERQFHWARASPQWPQAFSALTSWRPYHEAWDARTALSEIRKGAEKGRYDPKVVEVLNDIFRSTS